MIFSVPQVVFAATKRTANHINRLRQRVTVLHQDTHVDRMAATARVRGSKSFQPVRSRSREHFDEEVTIDRDREILRDRLRIGKRLHNEPLTESEELELVSSSVAENRKSKGPIDPNQAFLDCCMDRQLPDPCLSKCNFRIYTKDALTAMYFKHDPCPLAAMKEMQFCAAQGR
ncbi:unnamed protein product [Strongylus vulgaris]|uniref:Domain of unknown function DB domain-containing protein n=1 Tax=Strongylus vulgaris TaxID=40348 RepID=A0A3P7I414_STRVU|nr:unnamed protein product [Strongylus vulgaris]